MGKKPCWEKWWRGSLCSAHKLPLNSPALSTEPPLTLAALVCTLPVRKQLVGEDVGCPGSTLLPWWKAAGEDAAGGPREGLWLPHKLSTNIPKPTCPPSPHCQEHSVAPYFLALVGPAHVSLSPAGIFNLLSFASLSPSCSPSFKKLVNIPPSLSSTFLFFLRIYTFTHFLRPVFLWFMIIFSSKSKSNFQRYKQRSLSVGGVGEDTPIRKHGSFR